MITVLWSSVRVCVLHSKKPFFPPVDIHHKETLTSARTDSSILLLLFIRVIEEILYKLCGHKATPQRCCVATYPVPGTRVCSKHSSGHVRTKHRTLNKITINQKGIRLKITAKLWIQPSTYWSYCCCCAVESAPVSKQEKRACSSFPVFFCVSCTVFFSAWIFASVLVLLSICQ